MKDNLAITVKSLDKDFILPHHKKNSVKSVFTNILSLNDKSTEVQHALKDISFEVKKGEFFGIVGRNGSGKSTLLKILAGIYQPTQGSVQTIGRIVPFIELGVGFNSELTGRENVYLNGAMLGFSEDEVSAKYQEIVSFAELERFMDQKLKNYSSGMQVRLAFSVATVLAESDILLIDEVLAVGDADFQRKCFAYFKELKRRQKTVVFVTHDMGAVREYCDRAMLIDKSKIVASGKASSVALQYTRMFMEDNESNSDKNKAKKKRWGDNKAIFTKAELDLIVLKEHDECVKLKTIIKANEDIEEPVVGYMLKSEAGTPLTGNNTKIKKTSIGKLKANETCELRWKVPNIFADGKYTIDIAVTDSSGVTIHEWWEDAVTFKVYREEHVPYSIAPSVELEIIHQQK